MNHHNEDLAGFATRMWPRLVRSAMLLGCQRSDAEDFAQATLIRCIRKWSRVEQAQNMDAYVYKILLNEVRASYRSGHRRQVLVATIVNTPAHGDFEMRIAESDRLKRALDVLPRQQREALVLRFYCDLTERETAQLLNVPLGTIKSRVARALPRVNESLQATQSNEEETHHAN